MAQQHTANPGDFDDVRAETDQDAAGRKLNVHPRLRRSGQGFMRAFISRTASSIPVKSARLTML